VQIHLFPNGIGRHSRIIADIIMKNIFNKDFLNWGGVELYSDNNRNKYIDSLVRADRGEIEPLL
jgi:fido (protein-threonine AMPylation protein)